MQETNGPQSVPQERIVSIELPCIIRNLDNGLKALGGESHVKHVLDHRVGDSQIKNRTKSSVGPEPVVGLSLRPNDPYAKKLASQGIAVRNVLVKLTVPAWTGRKRKRGTNEPFITDSKARKKGVSVTASDLLKRLRDNPRAYHTEATGLITDAHRFRNLPDLQLRASDIPIMREVKNHLLEPKYETLRDFHVDLRPGPSNATTFVAPPAFIKAEQPHHYEYQQAPGVVYKVDASGNPTSDNAMLLPRRVMQCVMPDAAIPPPLSKDPKLRSLHGKEAPQCVKALEKLLEDRPLATKRYIFNALTDYPEHIVKVAMQYTGYTFKRGPFRDLLIKNGVDPRTDKQYRQYQALSYQFDKEWIASAKDPSNDRVMKGKDRTGYLFDGQKVSADGMTWQVCDVTDSILRGILNTDDIRDECDIHQWGWFYPGTVTKCRAIMRDKLKRMFLNEPVSDADYEILLQMPNIIDSKNMKQLYPDSASTNDNVLQLARSARNMMRAGETIRREKGLEPEAGAWALERGTMEDGGSGNPDQEEDGEQWDFAEIDARGDEEIEQNVDAMGETSRQRNWYR